MRDFIIRVISGNLVTIVLVIIVLTMGSSLIHDYFNPKVRVQKEFVEVDVPKEVVKIERVEIPVEKIVVIEKEKLIEEKPELPDWFKDSLKLEAISVGTVDPHEGETEIVSVIDTETGEGRLISRKKAPDLISFMNDKEVGFRYGYSTNGSEMDIYGRWTFLRVGGLHAALYVEGHTNPTDMGGMGALEVSFRW